MKIISFGNVTSTKRHMSNASKEIYLNELTRSPCDASEHWRKFYI